MLMGNIGQKLIMISFNAISHSPSEIMKEPVTFRT
jgi:hypothetical protein